MSKLPDLRRWQGWRSPVRMDLRVVERCAFCAFEMVAPFEQAREAFAAHVCDRPKPDLSKRRRGGFSFRR